MQLRQGPANADGADSSDRPAASGQRARNKIDKLQRIKESATQLFIEKGFDDTTTREIAVRASVGIGTLFNYANDKRDLLFLVYNRDLENIVETASKT
ncbi:TetR/AcrR family transcriptional regulator [Aquabacter sp. P-9]|uniref:TetR/AcrR family transcriptional regulator n=1 Tax=Aquabacter sediminis TaxID=3029197 RepID=UPI00237E7746|nr:helix-turn-helix domain-containing protein [Aquabacter sp. P-9]MDE1571149.1 helix-turn-helix domain containing protein [Aquabacter sp. P-9]